MPPVGAWLELVDAAVFQTVAFPSGDLWVRIPPRPHNSYVLPLLFSSTKQCYKTDSRSGTRAADHLGYLAFV